MKKLKIIIIITAILFLAIFLILINSLKEIDKKNELGRQGEKEVISSNLEFTSVNDYYTFFRVKSGIDKYFNYVDSKNKEAIYGVLDKKLIDNKKITKENVLEYVQNYNSKVNKYEIENIYVLNKFSKVIYYIDCKILTTGNDNFVNMYLNMTVNYNTNSVFSIAESSKEEFEKYINNSESNADIDLSDIIENDYNVLEGDILKDEDKVKKYFYDYIENAVYYKEFAYETLDKEFKEKRFGSLENYKKYLSTNNKILQQMELNKSKKYTDFNTYDEYQKYYTEKLQLGLRNYKVNKYDDYTQYICKDYNNNYYIFKVTDDMKYSVILDTYTVDLPQFKEKYDSSNEQERVILNIDRFFKSINNDDYKFAYSCLSDGFKNNYCKSVSEFENKINNSIFKNNNIEYLDFKNEGEIYIYNIKVFNEDKSSSKSMQIIMKLGNDTNFVMSFSIK